MLENTTRQRMQGSRDILDVLDRERNSFLAPQAKHECLPRDVTEATWMNSRINADLTLSARGI